MRPGLFEILIGTDGWSALPRAVRRMHGNQPQLRAQGQCQVSGDGTWVARLLRWLFGLPAPGSQVALGFELQRQGTCERWTRQFANRTMRSTLSGSPARTDRLRERLGPATLEFELKVADRAIEWRLQRLQLLGIGLPARWIEGIHARSGVRDDRYHFRTAARLPLVGLLVAYEGWLDHVD